ncbi:MULTISPECIES: hypothetical protein [Streptomyces]|uniref:hypothetical protein n=1 Tax=Streptomyces TaxID=1883 RepID=UPI0033DAE1FD
MPTLLLKPPPYACPVRGHARHDVGQLGAECHQPCHSGVAALPVHRPLGAPDRIDRGQLRRLPCILAEAGVMPSSFTISDYVSGTALASTVATKLFVPSVSTALRLQERE